MVPILAHRVHITNILLLWATQQFSCVLSNY